MKKYYLAFFSVALGVGLVSGDVKGVWAQDEFTLEEITVTAQKREENQQNVPITMDVISSDEIKELAKNDIAEILSNSSSTIIQKAADGYRISIRGMSDMSSPRGGQSLATPTVAVNTDNVLTNRKDTASGLYDLERVEVLYGPQSTMYSSNSPGGIVNIVTALPKTDRFDGSTSFELGSYHLLHTEGFMNVPLSEKAAIRASFTSSVRDPYVDNGVDNEDTKSGRLRALFQPSDKYSITATAEVTRDTGNGFGGGVEPFVDQDDEENPWTGADETTGASSNKTSAKFYGQMNWDTGFGELSLIPSYSTRDGNSVSIQSQDDSMQFYNQKARETSIEMKMTSPSDFLFKWITGITYYDSYDRSYYYSTVDTFGDKTLTENIKAFFVNVTYPVTDIFRVTGGYRKSWDELATDNEEVIVDSRNPGATETRSEHWNTDTQGLSDYKVGFEYDLGESSMFYGDYSTSYRVQGMGNRGTGGVPIENLKAYTMGAKNRFFGNKLQLNASVYYYDYTNFQANGQSHIWLWDLDNDLNDDENEKAEVRNMGNLGDGRIMGFDLQTNTIITPNDMLNLSVSYTKSEWTDLQLNYGEYTYTLVLVNDKVLSVPLDGNYTGKPMMNTPPWTITMKYDHNFNLPNGGLIKSSITSKYRTSYRLSWDDFNYPYDYQEDYHMEDVSMTYSHSDGKWSLTGYVNNIFNYAEKVMYIQPNMTIGNPRTYGGVLSIKF